MQLIALDEKLDKWNWVHFPFLFKLFISFCFSSVQVSWAILCLWLRCKLLLVSCDEHDCYAYFNYHLCHLRQISEPGYWTLHVFYCCWDFNNPSLVVNTTPSVSFLTVSLSTQHCLWVNALISGNVWGSNVWSLWRQPRENNLAL